MKAKYLINLAASFFALSACAAVSAHAQGKYDRDDYGYVYRYNKGKIYKQPRYEEGYGYKRKARPKAKYRPKPSYDEPVYKKNDYQDDYKPKPRKYYE